MAERGLGGSGVRPHRDPVCVVTARRYLPGVLVSDAGNDRVVHWAPGAEAGTVVAGGQGMGDKIDQLAGPM